MSNITVEQIKEIEAQLELSVNNAGIHYVKGDKIGYKMHLGIVLGMQRLAELLNIDGQIQFEFYLNQLP